jgi:Protein of unknown function (DUF2917)
MFEVLVTTPTRKSIAAWGLPMRDATRQTARPMAGVSGNVDHDRVAVFAHLQGQLILCSSGQLWVTIENDREDHVLAPGQCLFVPTAGKVVIGGIGCYTL